MKKRELHVRPDPYGGRGRSRTRKCANLTSNHFRAGKTEGSTGGYSKGSSGRAIRDKVLRGLKLKSGSPWPKASNHFWHGESEDGWAISEVGLEKLTQRGWSDPNFLVGRYAGRAMMDFLRAGKEGTVLFPWAEPTAGHVMEALDRTDDVPLLIPSIHMDRTYGRTMLVG